MSLADKLNALKKASAEKFPAEIKQQMFRATQELTDSGIMDKALNVGGKMPSFKLPNIEGELVNSEDLLKKGNLVVTFYRGYW